MIRFIIVFMSIIVLAYWCFFYLGSRQYEVIKDGGKAKKWSKEKQDTFSKIIRRLFKLLAISVIAYYIIPMTMDMSYLISKDYDVFKGSPKTVNQGPFGSWYIVQFVHVEGDVLLYYGYKPIDPDEEYEFIYLPRSKFGMSVKRLDD